MASRPFSFLFFLLILSPVTFTTADTNGTTNIGAIIDANSQAGKEQRTAMLIAVENFNTNSKNLKLNIHFHNSTGDPLQAASSAEELIKEKNVRVIIGMNTWEEAALVASIGQRAQLPVISFSGAAITPPLAQFRWPFLVQMATNSSEEVNCIAAMVNSYNWKRVIVVYEDNAYGGEYSTLSLLSEALQNIGSEIEHRLILPNSYSDSKEIIREELEKVRMKQSRVFIVLQSSLETVSRVFKEASQIGLTGRDSVWILTDSVSSLLDSVDASDFSFMEGAIGIKTYYPEKSRPFLDFRARFRKKFRLDYPEKDKFEPGIHALRAYDSVNSVSQVMENLGSENSSKTLLYKLLSTNFSGLSGRVHFYKGKLNEKPTFRIVNLIGKSYKELGFWSSKFGFSDSLGKANEGDDHSMKILSAPVTWPGNLVSRYPKGWAMPTKDKVMRIGVPSGTSFERFVKVERIESLNETKFTGFCIDIFKAAIETLESEQGYTLPYEFVNHSVSSYDDLVEQVYYKTYDAAVGDITILANRSKYVEFTQPFTESGLSMVVPVKSEPHKAWKFLRPFTHQMWIATFGILFYTMFVVWFMEHQINQDFKGPWKDQLGTALWFTFSSLFFAHREKIQSNYSKVVVMTWLFVVFILTSSYTASLTSMLTVQMLEPTVTDIGWLRQTNATVGCDPDSFVGKYLKDVLFLENIKNVSNQYEYPEEFKSGNIAAAFLELPYQKVFLKEYCNKYTAAGPAYKLGGLGFVFEKGSPIADDVSEAILTLLQNGKIQDLENTWLNTSRICSSNGSGVESDSLSLDSFWGIFLISGLISTLCLVLFLVRLLKDNSLSKVVQVVQHLNSRVLVSPSVDNQRNSSRWEPVSPTEIPEHLEVGRPMKLEISMGKLDHVGENMQ